MKDKVVPFPPGDDSTIELENLCLKYGCKECPGRESRVAGVIILCMHGCHKGEAV